MLCCYTLVASRKNRKKNTNIGPLNNIEKIHVYEDKRKIKTVYPLNPCSVIEYDKKGIQMN